MRNWLLIILMFVAPLTASASILGVQQGGTGWGNIQAGGILYGNGTGSLATTSQGIGGQVLSWQNGVPTWVATSSIQNITLTTTGTSGVATLTGNTLNIPQYSSGGTSGGLATTSPWTTLNLAQVVDNGHVTSIATSSLRLTTSSFNSPNISQWTNDSGYITGNQTITLSGAVTGSGTTAVTTSFGSASNGVLTNAASGSAVPTFQATSTLYKGTPGQVLAFLNGAWIGAATTTFSSPLLYSAGNVTCQTATGSVPGCLAAADFTTFNGKQAAGNYITALTGDVTASGPGSVAATLATVNGNIGSFTNANITVNAKGLITAAANGTATGSGLSTTTPLSNSNLLVYSASGAGSAYGVGTSTPTLGLGLSYSGTLGSFAGGSSGSLSIATSSLFTGTTGQNAYFSGTNTIVGTSTIFTTTGSLVGIGLTAPAVQLEANGIIRADRTNVPTQYLQIDGGGPSGQEFQAVGANKQFFISSLDTQVTAGANNGILFRTNTTASPIIHMQLSNSGLFVGGPSITASKSQLDVLGNVSIGSSYAGVTAAPTDGLIVQGNVGIGTTSPSSRLNVSGSDSGTTITNASVAMADVTNSDTTANNFSDYALSGINSTGSSVVDSKIVGIHVSHTATAESGSLAFMTRNAGSLTEKMRILNTGNIGLGTTSPYALLSVAGGNLVVGATTAGGTPGDLFLPKLGTAAGSFLAVDALGKVIATTSPTGGSGTVTSVSQTVPSFLSVSGSPVTTSGTLAISYSGTALPIANGGTGQTTFTSSQLLYGNGTGGLFSVGTTTPTFGLGLTGTNMTDIANAAGASSLSIATSSLYTGTTGQFPYFSGTNTMTATSSIFINTKGMIGIGTTSPFSQFSVSTSAQQSGLLPLFTVASTTNATLLTILGNGNLGLATTSPFANFSLVGNNTALFAIATSTATNSNKPIIEIDNTGHMITSGPTPTVSACGSGPNGSVSGNDTNGTITIGGGVVSSCVLTFANPVKSGTAPDCVATGSTAGNFLYISSSNSTSVTFGYSGAVAGGTITYYCPEHI